MKMEYLQMISSTNINIKSPSPRHRGHRQQNGCKYLWEVILLPRCYNTPFNVIKIIMVLVVLRIVLHAMTILQDITLAIKRLVSGSVEPDGTVQAVKCIVSLMMMKRMDTTHVSLAQGERCVYKDGMGPVVKCTVFLGMIPFRGIPAIHRDKRFVCKTGMVKTSATFIANKPMTPVQITTATQMETKYV